MIDGGETARKLILNLARYSGLAPLARPFMGGIGAILMLHRVTATPERPDGVNRHLNIDPSFLDRVVAEMKADDYDFVSMDEAVARLRAGGGGRRFATITADDAYRDNLREALPVLERHGAPITIYTAPALIDGDADLWWEVVEDIAEAGRPIAIDTPSGPQTLDCSTSEARLAAIGRLHAHLTDTTPEEGLRDELRRLARRAGVDPDRPRRAILMDWTEVAEAAAHPLVTIGAHTVHHHNLKRLGEAAALKEMVDSAALLKDRLGVAPRHMAYPYGYASAVGCREVKLARQAGYETAVTTRHGVLRPEHAQHLHALPRISINGRYQNVGYVSTMLSGVTTPLANRGRMLVTV